MADLSKIHAVFGSTLPEAHIFFATRANTEIPSYQALRDHLGKTTAHTNRKLWLLFVAEYTAAYPPVPLAFTTDLPTSKNVDTGAPITLTVAVEGGTSPYTYVWKKAGTVVSGQTTATFNKATSVTGDAGAYTVEVTDATGAKITSATCNLTVQNPT